MAGDWIKFELATPDKPEVWAIAAKLSIDPDAVVGKLMRVWGWFDQQTENGIAHRASTNMLDRMVGCQGFCEAVSSAGWMIISDDSISLPEFNRHNGKTAKNRINTAKRVAAYKSRKKNDLGNAEVTQELLSDNARVSIPRPIRKLIIERDGGMCVYCGRKDGEYTPPETQRDAIISIDHVIPVSRQGSENIENLVCCCMSCNNFKNDRTPDEAGLLWPTDKSGKRYGSVTSALPKEEKRREDKTSTSESPTHDPVDPLLNCPHKAIIEIYHRILPELPRVLDTTWKGSSREKDLQARWRHDKRHQSLDFWEAYFEGVARSKFHLGDNDRCWKADLGWLVKRSNFDKMVERIQAEII